MCEGKALELSKLYKLFPNSQHGFIASKSTDVALCTHIMDTCSSIEDNKVTIGVYLDLAKAFDTVEHNILINKLKHVGIGGTMLTGLNPI